MNQNTVSYKQAKQLVRLSFEDRIPLIIIGNPGVGKTSIVRQVAEELSVPCMETLGYLFEPVDFRGLLVPNNDDKRTVSYSLNKWPLERDNKIPDTGILLLDEFLNSHRDVLTAFAEPLCDHAVNGERLKSGWTIIGTGNHIGGGTSAGAMPVHVANRVSIVHIEPDWDEWMSWAIGHIRPELVGYFQMQNGVDLFAYDPKKITSNQPYLTPRSLENLSKRLDAWDRVNPGIKPPLHVYSSMVGEYGGKLFATLDYINQLVPWHVIEANPQTCPLPTHPAAVYAQIQIIIGIITKCKNSIPKRISSAAAAYIDRFGKQEICAAAHTLLVKHTNWHTTQECAAWMKENQSMI